MIDLMTAEKTVQDIIFKLPQTYDYDQPSFFVRSCYPVYYNLIGDLLNGRDEHKIVENVTVTGTPGVGKSVFYIYFFQRWIEENPESIIITASFTRRRNLKQCVLFDIKNPSGLICKDIPFIEGALHLYDGPPPFEPQDNQMVCFISPNSEWYDSMIKSPRHRCLYMPVWTIEELLEADSYLQINLGEDKLKQRFDFFGGSARYCLATDDAYFCVAEKDLRNSAESITSFKMIPKIIQNGGSHHLCHRIFHVCPNWRFGLPLSYSLFFCSRFIANKIYQSVKDFSDAQRAQMMGWVRSESMLASVVKDFFEICASCALSQGGKFEALSISNKPDTNVDIELPKNQYSKLGWKNTECVDGHWYNSTTGILYLFKYTLRSTCHFNTNGIISFIEKLGIHEITFDRVRLVYVVPDDQNIGSQSVTCNRFPISSKPALGFLEGISTDSNQTLRSQNIFTDPDLHQAIQLNDKRKSECAFLESFRETKCSILSNFTKLFLKLDFAQSARS